MLEPTPLKDKIKLYNPDADLDRVHRAYEFAKDKHGDQKRASGEPYYTHPMEVADILADMRMDPDTVITAILHDTIEDTDATKEDITELFGKEVANLVNGVTKLTRIESQTVEGKQAENFRKLVLAMSEDIRVLIVKLADRLHNIRTLGNISKCRHCNQDHGPRKNALFDLAQDAKKECLVRTALRHYGLPHCGLRG